MSALDEAQIPVREGDVLAGKFRVEKVLGAGGMGVVVAARHVELRQRVALKFLLPAALGSAEHTERFLREAQAVVRLKSEHVAKVLDIGRLDDGAPYIVMEYLDGSDLSHYLAEKGPLPVEEAVGYVLQACEALAEAHALGIIHRDMKPQNLFLTRRPDGRAQVKVLDFGISKTISATSQAPLSLTRTSTIIGSPLYMSPEQMRSGKSATERSDIWSLGVIMYELLTGRVPFLAETMPDLCFKVAQDVIIPPVDLRADIPVELSDVILRCLERDVAKRMANVAELAVALEPFVPAPERGAASRVSTVLRVPTKRSAVTARVPAVTARPVVVGAATGSSAWGKTQNAPGARGRKLAIVGAGVAAAAVAVTLTVVAVRGGGATETRSPAASAIASTPPPAASAAPVATQAATLASVEPIAPTPSSVAAPTPSKAIPRATIAAAPAVPPKPTAKPAASGPPRAWE
jgi:tRNA A-37 threonylcarbamoyl transferase component Bud32